jgi:hypothetical protein
MEPAVRPLLECPLLFFWEVWATSYARCVTFVIWYVYCWPIIPTMAAFLAAPQRRALLGFCGYVVIGAAIVLAWSALTRFALGFMDVSPVSNVQSYAWFLGREAWLPFLIILITGNRRLRSISPFVLAGLLVFSFSNLAIGNALVAGLDYQVFRDIFVSFDARVMRGLLFLIAALPVGYLCWRGLSRLSRYFERKVFSDTQLLVDSWWLIVALWQSTEFANDLGWGGLAGLLAFVAYRSVVALGLAFWPVPAAVPDNSRLLLLRVFGFQRRTERLFDVIAQRWRLLGSVKLIAGPDLAMRTMDPADFIAFVGGRMQRLFVRSPRDLTERVERLDEARDPDGRCRIAKFWCYEDTWRATLSELLRRSDVVLMDLRGFSAANSGCEFELRQLGASGLLPRTVFAIDDATDVGLLKSIVHDVVSEPGAMPLNLQRITSGSAGGLDRTFESLRVLAANQPPNLPTFIPGGDGAMALIPGGDDAMPREKFAYRIGIGLALCLAWAASSAMALADAESDSPFTFNPPAGWVREVSQDGRVNYLDPENPENCLIQILPVIPV